jgi:predicted transposase YbfD/YdcC
MSQNPSQKQSLMIPQSRPLIAVLADIPDFRKSRGKRHALPSILALACCAALCGYRSYSAMAEWGRHYGHRFRRLLGFTHQTPSASTLHTIFRHLGPHELEAKLGAWAASVAAALPALPALPLEATAIDGKTLRGSKKQGAPGVHLLSALSHYVGMTVAQLAVDEKSNEITAIDTLLSTLVLKGRVVTLDALLTQRATAQQIINQGGDYVMIVKENQPKLRADIAQVFALPPWGDPQPRATTLDLAHGRIEQRTLTTSESLVGYSEWPGLAQVFCLERQVITKKHAKKRMEIVYGVTSLAASRATPAQLLALVRGHWHIENKSHWVRDVTFDEDRSQVRCGHIPQVMAAIRNTAIGLLRSAGYTNIAKACRQMAAQPQRALALIGIEIEN